MVDVLSEGGCYMGLDPKAVLGDNTTPNDLTRGKNAWQGGP